MPDPWPSPNEQLLRVRGAFCLPFLPAYPLFLFLQRCFQTTNGYVSDSRACPSNYSVAALATSSLVGRSG